MAGASIPRSAQGLPPRLRRAALQGYLRPVTQILAWIGDGPLTEVAPEGLAAVLADARATVWVDFGPSDAAEAERLLRDVLHVHPLAIEDCLSPREQPKIDDYGDYLFLVTHGVTAQTGEALFRSVEFNAFLWPHTLVTFHRDESRSVAETVASVHKAGYPLRRGAAAVLHEIADRQIDHYWPVLEELEARLDAIEDALFERPRQALLEEILGLKRSTLALRRSLVKQRDVVHRLARREFALVPEADAWLFRDVEDHIVRAADLLENYRELLGGAVEVYLSVISYRLNGILKVLTIFSTIVLPMSLVASVYGMNFRHLPELEWRFGYYFALALMALIAVVLLMVFWVRGWLTEGTRRPRRAARPAPLLAGSARLDPEARRQLRVKDGR
jgi:magnesium transporter